MVGVLLELLDHCDGGVLEAVGFVEELLQAGNLVAELVFFEGPGQGARGAGVLVGEVAVSEGHFELGHGRGAGGGAGSGGVVVVMRGWNGAVGVPADELFAVGGSGW